MNGRGDTASGVRNAVHQPSRAARKPFAPAYGPDKSPSDFEQRHSPFAMGKISNRLPRTAAVPAPLSRSPGYVAGNFWMRLSGSRSAEHERTVGATESDRVGRCVVGRP